jgi:cobalt-zinc-cadmium efflux system outer membrane protein
LVGTVKAGSLSYLHERRHKRELRLESARKGTIIAVSTQTDLMRNMLFGLRSAFVSALQAKAVVQVAKENLTYYDRVLEVSRIRFKVGDIAKVDLDRLELQRVQYESDLETAKVNLQTAKITLLQFMNDRSPVDQFDVSGTFDFSDQLMPLDQFRQTALDTRPDLKAAMQAVDKAGTDYRLAAANGSTDPTFSGWWTHNGSYNFSPGNNFGRDTVGASISIPLRIFDRNQGEKLRTKLDVARNERLRDAAEAQVFSDVDSAYATLNSDVILLRPYKAKYLQMSVSVRDTVFYAYQKGKASLLDFLNAENDYRAVQRNYVTLIGAYLTAAAQLNQAVGREVIP